MKAINYQCPANKNNRDLNPNPILFYIVGSLVACIYKELYVI